MLQSVVPYIYRVPVVSLTTSLSLTAQQKYNGSSCFM